jgi:hypothetical protein
VDGSKTSNPLVGTWKVSKVADSTGKTIEYFEGEEGYNIFLENGTFLNVGFRKNFPRISVAPSTIEEYKAIVENSYGGIYTYTYTVDEKNPTFSFKCIFEVNPQNIGNDFTLNYKVEGDTLKWTWRNNERTFFAKAVRVK